MDNLILSSKLTRKREREMAGVVRERGGGEGEGQGGRERERDCLFCKFVYYSNDFFPIAGGYFVAVRGRLSPDKLLLNN